MGGDILGSDLFKHQIVKLTAPTPCVVDAGKGYADALVAAVFFLTRLGFAGTGSCACT